jgi:hypothetical protein
MIVLQAGPSVEQICGDGEANQRDKHSPMLGVRYLRMCRSAFDVLHCGKKICFMFLHEVLNLHLLCLRRDEGYLE